MRSTVLSLVLLGLLSGVACGDGTSDESSSGDILACQGVQSLAKGAAIHGANGIRFGADGHLYIASIAGREIVVMNPDDGSIVERLGPSKGVEGPDDLAFGPDGSIYWASLLTGEIGRLANGVKTVQVVAPGVDAIAFSKDGRLFTAADFLSDGLYEVDPNFEKPARLIAKDLGFLNGMEFGPDGKLYGPLFAKGQVVRVDVDADDPATPALEAKIDVVASGFAVPAAAKFDANGKLHVVDFATGVVSRVDVTTGDKTAVATLEPGLDNLAFDSKNRLFVSNTQNGVVYRVESDGKATALNEAGLVAAGGIAAVDAGPGKETLFVTNLWSLVQFDTAGKEIGRDRRFFSPDGLIAPFTASADGANVLLTSWFPSSVQVWDPVGHRQVATAIFEDNSIVPLNAVRYQGKVAVADAVRHGIVWLDLATKNVEPLAMDIALPVGLAVRGDELWATDWATGSVLHVAKNGAVDKKPIATGLKQPEGLAIDKKGRLVVVEAGERRVVRFDPSKCSSSCTPEVLATDLAIGAQGIPTAPPSWLFSGVAITSSNEIYVTSDVDSGFQKVCGAR